MNTITSDYRASELSHIIASNAGEMNDLERKMERLLSELEKMKVGYEPLMTTEEERELFLSFNEEWNQYLDINEDVIAISRMLKTDSAMALVNGNSQKNFDEASTILVKIMNSNRKQGEVASAYGDQLYDTSRITIIVILSIIIVLAVILAFWIINTITKALAYANGIVKEISEGNLAISIDNSSKDEVGDLLNGMSTMVNKLKEVLTFVSTASDHIATASNQMSSTSQQMSQGSQEQAASAEQISSSMEEMVSNIQQNTDNAQQTEKIALKAAEDIQDGSKSVNMTVDSMKKIADKISIIGEIARQTNLLALNAAVEAARAGDHGKGFAVVAAEVRKLAERSQLAAAEINDLSSSSVSIADKSGKILETIVPNIQSTAKLVQEISAASLEQNTGAEQVNNAIQQFNQIIQQNAAASEEMATGSEELASQADHLRDAISFFKIDKNQGSQRSSSSSVGKQRPATSHTPMAQKSNKVNPSKKGVSLEMSSNGNGHADHLDNGYEKY
jgi:methyl-accepting chemotaxis protein